MPLNPEARLRYGERLLEQAVAAQSAGKQAASHRIIASAQNELRHYDQALRHYRAARRLHQHLRLSHHATVDLAHVGHTLFIQGDTGQARRAYQAALQAFTTLRQPTAAAYVLGQLGLLYGRQQKWQQALASQQQALRTWQQNRDSAKVAATLNALGNLYYQQRQYSRALFHLRRAMQVARPTDSLALSESLNSVGQVYQDLSNDEQALTSFLRAEQLLPHAAPAGVRATLWQGIAAAHDSLGHWSAAQQALLSSLPIARLGGSKAQLSAIYQALAAVYRRTGNYRQALAAMTRFAGLKDSAFAEERSAQVAELRTRYETEKKEREIQLLIKDRQIQEANLRRQKVVRNALAAGAVLLLLMVAGLYRGRQQQVRVNRLLERKNAAINRQKEELGRLNQTKDTLFSVISHDLRSPLSSLYSLLSLLNMGALPPERLALHSARLTRGLNNTLLLLDNLLNWSAAQMKKDKIRPERVRLDVLAEEAVALLLGDAERKTILLLNQLPVPTLVRADVNMVRLVLRNLLGNAIKFTPEGGTVTLTAAAQGTMWAVSVHDTGIGIAAADQDKVFGKAGPFSTLGTAREKGTGLGLQLCQDFVERNGGQLSLASIVGQGTTFTFTLPALSLGPAAGEAESGPALTAVAAAESGTGSQFAP
ncbi:ATP-binding protein [Hymenobacter aquaticus]|uniref:ATP-binding protein n=1 Tax=Hymenobacter aquaticus TaxID=1867101 RepID=UPI001436A95D|nr:ATP-binding protein [Hymenobacter aquaticus]